MEQTAPAAAAPAPAVTAAAPDVAIATSTAPVIITPQAIGWAAPVLNFGSVLPLQSSPFFPNLASGNFWNISFDSLALMCVLVLTQRQAHPHPPWHLISLPRCLAMTLLLHPPVQRARHLPLKATRSRT